MKKYFFFSVVMLFFSDIVWGQSDYPWLRFGDELYNKGAYPDAETAYRKALEEKEKSTTAYNLGNTVYYQNRIPEAIQQFQKSIETTKDPLLKSKAYYNLGNAHFQNQEFEKSIQAYRESLKLQPQDEEAKKNLILAMRQLQLQQQEQQQQQQKQEQENKDEDSEEEKDQQQEQQSSSSSQSQSQSKKEKSQSPQDVSQKESREILKTIEREDQRVQEKLKRSAGKSAPPVKDW